jgi:predicted dienelactone hydrolase
LDLTKIGVFGHSFGGATALQVCHDDSRCKAGIDIDGMAFGSVIADGVKQPFMFLGGDHHREPKAETQPVWRDLHAIYERLPANGRVALMIEGADHYSFADGGVLKSHIALAVLRGLGLVIDGKRQLVTTAACVRAFFGKYLTEEVDTMRGCTELQGVKPVGLAADGE